jgi:hypothetical protein
MTATSSCHEEFYDPHHPFDPHPSYTDKLPRSTTATIQARRAEPSYGVTADYDVGGLLLFAYNIKEKPPKLNF